MTIDITEDSSHIRSFLDDHSVGVLATANKAAIPYASTIYFVVEDDLSISFLTKEDTAKCRNMRENPNVALAVTDAQSQSTVQIAGTVQEIKDASRIQQLHDKVVTITVSTSSGATPPVMKLDAGELVAFSIQPSFVRLARFLQTESSMQIGSLFETITR